MKKVLIALLSFSMLLQFQAKADEGMWLPLLLKNYNYEDMKKKGLKLTPEQLYDVNHSSLKDAIVWFVVMTVVEYYFIFSAYEQCKLQLGAFNTVRNQSEA